MWVSIAYPGVVLFGVGEASRVKKTREVEASTYRGSETREVLAKRLNRVLRNPEGGSHGEEDQTSEFHRRTSLELIQQNRTAYIHREVRPQRGIHEVEIREHESNARRTSQRYETRGGEAKKGESYMC